MREMEREAFSASVPLERVEVELNAIPHKTAQLSDDEIDFKDPLLPLLSGHGRGQSLRSVRSQAIHAFELLKIVKVQKQDPETARDENVRILTLKVMPNSFQ